jgi:hypothetical protein
MSQILPALKPLLTSEPRWSQASAGLILQPHTWTAAVLVDERDVPRPQGVCKRRSLRKMGSFRKKKARTVILTASALAASEGARLVHHRSGPMLASSRCGSKSLGRVLSIADGGAWQKAGSDARRVTLGPAPMEKSALRLGDRGTEALRGSRKLRRDIK